MKCGVGTFLKAKRAISLGEIARIRKIHARLKDVGLVIRRRRGGHEACVLSVCTPDTDRCFRQCRAQAP